MPRLSEINQENHRRGTFPCRTGEPMAKLYAIEVAVKIGNEAV
jgi:hypothetical protein